MLALSWLLGASDPLEDLMMPHAVIEQTERSVLNLLLATPRSWTLNELRRELDDRELPIILNALARLKDSGVIHWYEEFVLPTRAAIRADQLSL